MFFQFDQNNSGGSFSFDEDRGITHHVIVEEEDYASANNKAEEIGIYFYGCSDGSDCPCCGDRWSPASSREKGDEKPLLYGEPVESASSYSKWMPEGKEICVHYKDGRKEWFGFSEKEF